MNEKWLVFIVYICVSLGLAVIVLLPNIHKKTSKDDIITGILCFLWPIWSFIMIGGVLALGIEKANEKTTPKETPSYGKAFAEINKKWDINNPAPPQIQAARLMYDYLTEWYENEN